MVLGMKDTPFWLDLLIMAFATYRLTRLVVMDTILGQIPGSPNTPRGTGLRRALDEFAYTEEGGDRSIIRGFIGDLWTCRWCIGFWIAAAVTAGWVLGPEWLRWVLVVFSVAGVAGRID